MSCLEQALNARHCAPGVADAGQSIPGDACITNGLFSVPVQYVCWAELLYIQLLTPKASFMGHLGGILAGLLHVNVLEHLALPSGGLSFRWAQ